MKIECRLTVLLLAITVQSAFSSVVLVTSRSGLSGSDFLPISTVGGDGTTEPSTGFTVNTNGGNHVTISDTGTSGFTVLQEGNDWSGNFAKNDLVLWTSGDGVPTTLAFGTAVGGVGTQIQADVFDTGFTASITAFDGVGNNLGSFTEHGVSNGNNDNSAIFIGVLSSSTNIAKITLNITVPPSTDYAFNELSFGAVTTPEPSSLALLFCGAIFLPVLMLKRRHQSRQ